MKLKRFYMTTDSLPEIENFLSSPGIIIKKLHIAAHDNSSDVLSVFFEEASEQLATEKEELQNLDQIAQQLEEDADYAKLKNATQRELFLLSKYDIPSTRAKQLIELVNLRKILQADRD